MSRFNKIYENILKEKYVDPPIKQGIPKIEVIMKGVPGRVDFQKELKAIVGDEKLLDPNWPSFEPKPLGIDMEPNEFKKHADKIKALIDKYPKVVKGMSLPEKYRKSLNEAKDADGEELQIGDDVGFKKGKEMSGTIIEIKGNNLVVEVYPDGNRNREPETMTISARDCWLEFRKKK